MVVGVVVVVLRLHLGRNGKSQRLTSLCVSSVRDTSRPEALEESPPKTDKEVRRLRLEACLWNAPCSCSVGLRRSSQSSFKLAGARSVLAAAGRDGSARSSALLSR